MDKKFKIGVAVIAVCMIGIAICTVLTVFLLRDSRGAQTEYTRTFQLAEEYMETGDYDMAILSYWDAIEANSTQVIPYLRLVELYEQRGENNMILKVLHLGVENTNSDELIKLLKHYEPTESALESDDENETYITTLAIKTSFLKAVAENTYGDYQDTYGTPTIQYADGICAVTYSNLNVTFYYYNEGSDVTTVNRSTQKPYIAAKPNYIITNDISLLFSGAGDIIPYQSLQSMGLSRLEMVDNMIRFVQNSCIVQISSDETGVVMAGAQIKILPSRRTVAETEGSLSMTGTVIDAVTGYGVAGASLRLTSADGADMDPVNLSSASDGNYTIDELSAGEYSLEISANGYITETFEVELDGSADVASQDFVISPELTEGEIRIVLEWGETPRDLDSHLFCDMDDGTEGTVSWRRKSVTSSHGVVATLDVDDIDGYGPETTTISDLNGTFDFVVEDYGQTGTMGQYGATVKIYMPGQNAPTVVWVPSSVDNIWYVCNIDHGVLEVVNGNQY